MKVKSEPANIALSLCHKRSPPEFRWVLSLSRWMKESVWRRNVLMFVLAWGVTLSASSIVGNWMFRAGLAAEQGKRQGIDLVAEERTGRGHDCGRRIEP